MENKASFDLNSEIARWRAELDQSGALGADNLEELEGHLRDSVLDLQNRGLSDKEAFLVAGRRVGSSHALVSEFSKVRAGQVWIDRTLWIVVGMALFEALVSLQSSVVLSSILRLSDLPLALLLVIRMAPFVAALLMLRSIVRGTGWTPRTLNALARTPLRISAVFFCLGLSTIFLRMFSLSRITWFAFAVWNTALWLTLSLVIWGVARARTRQAAG